MKKYKILYAFLIAFSVSSVGLIIHWHLRENPHYKNEQYNYEVLCEIREGHHNAFTDLIFWNNKFYLIFRVADSHIAHNSKLVLKSSDDAINWTNIAEFRLPEFDIRDPKLCTINNELMIYVLENDQYPFVHVHRTLFSKSTNGKTFTPLSEVEPNNWMLWRPKQINDSTWYSAGVKSGYHESALFKSENGINWVKITDLKDDILHNEFAIQLLKNELYGIVRIEGENFAEVLFGSTNKSAIGASVFPFTDWNFATTEITKLDGPFLFDYKNKVYALGRFEPFDTGNNKNLFARKRTSLFELQKDSLIHILNLPSSGDTGYGGVVVKDSSLYISYYTNDIQTDYPWLLGQFKETKVCVIKIDIKELP